MKKPDSYITPLIPGCRYHIYNRGNNFQDVFRSANDYEQFLKKWREFVYPVAMTHGYHLLPNHFHAIIEIRSAPLTFRLSENQLLQTNKSGTPLWIQKGISNFFNSYSRTFQNRYQSNGALFHSPFKRKMILDDSYFLQLMAYVHWNAHKHCLSTGKLLDQVHCSYREVILGTNPWLERNDILRLLGGLDGFVRFHEERGSRYW